MYTEEQFAKLLKVRDRLQKISKRLALDIDLRMEALKLMGRITWLKSYAELIDRFYEYTDQDWVTHLTLVCRGG